MIVLLRGISKNFGMMKYWNNGMMPACRLLPVGRVGRE